MLNDWSDRLPDPPPRIPRAARYAIGAIIALTALALAIALVSMAE